MKIKTIQLQRAISLNIGNHFLKPKIVLEAELSDNESPDDVVSELQKQAELLWMKECLASISELGEVSGYDHIDQYAESLIDRIDKLEDEDG